MKTNKITLSATVGLCTLLCIGTSTAQGATSAFQDTTGHWAANAIERMSGYQIVNGYEGKFRPNDTITRGELAVVLNNVMQYQQKADNTFSDLGQAFYTDAILKAARADVMYGANGKVRPTDPISRQEAVAMMARAFDVEGVGNNISVPDAEQIADWAKGSVSAFMQKGYIDGVSSFRPTASITRAEVVTILNRLLCGYYATSGNFSESTNGTVVINTKDVTLKDTVIDGDLILSEGIKDGDVTLDNVTVKGRTLIRGGGVNSIHVTGNSVLNTVVMERDGAAVRIAVDKNAKVSNVIVGEKSTESIISGYVPNVTVSGSAKLTAQNAKFDTVSVTASNVSLVATGESIIKNVEVTDTAKNTDISVAKDAAINTINIQADGAKVFGEGKVSDVKANANNIAVHTKGTKVSAEAGSSNVTAEGKNVEAGTSVTINTPSNNKPSHTGSSSSGGNHSSRPEKLAIAKVESVENGLVRMTLNHASDKPLTRDQFTIICTGAGKNMTILRVETKDNRVYDLHTAFYNDNTYQLGLQLEDGTLLTYDFVSKYDCPAITDVQAVRTTKDKVDFSYMSDIAGTFYYTLKADEMTRFRRAYHDEPTAESIMETGIKHNMVYGGNVFEITKLKENTPYTMYYVAKGTDEKVTSVKSLQIAGEPVEAPPTSDITIESVSAHRIPNTDFGQEHIRFDIKLSEPTDTKLDTKNFKIECPNGPITLGRVESDDKQNYTVYMAKGYKIQDGNFTLTITFADGTIATQQFFTDLTAPDISISKYGGIERFAQREAKVTFTTNEAGKMYWTVLKGTDFGANGGTPKKLQTILDANHEIQTFDTAGTHYFNINFADKAVDAETDLYICFFSEDKAGNRPNTFDYEKIPDTVTKPEQTDPDQPQSEYQIVNITRGINDTGNAHSLSIEFSKSVENIVSKSDVQITGDSLIIQGDKDIWSSSVDSTTSKVFDITLNAKILPQGNYKFMINIAGTTLTKDFTVDAAGNINE